MPTPTLQTFDGLSYHTIPRLVTALPYEVLHILDIFPGSVLAGGAIASILTGQPVKDYDIFISGTAQLEAVKKRLNDYMGAKPEGHWASSRRAETWIPDLGVKYTLKGDQTSPAAPIQIIHAYAFYSPTDLLRQFDYTIAQAGLFWNPVSSRFGGSWGVVGVRGYLEDLLARQLVYNPLSLPSAPEPPQGVPSTQQSFAFGSKENDEKVKDGLDEYWERKGGKPGPLANAELVVSRDAKGWLDNWSSPAPPSPVKQADGDPGGNFIQEDVFADLTLPTLQGSAIAGAFYRLVKYTSRGYHITPDSLAALMHNWTEYVDWARKTGLEPTPETADSILDLFVARTSPPINVGDLTDFTV